MRGACSSGDGEQDGLWRPDPRGVEAEGGVRRVAGARHGLRPVVERRHPHRSGLAGGGSVDDDVMLRRQWRRPQLRRIVAAAGHGARAGVLPGGPAQAARRRRSPASPDRGRAPPSAPAACPCTRGATRRSARAGCGCGRPAPPRRGRRLRPPDRWRRGGPSARRPVARRAGPIAAPRSAGRDRRRGRLPPWRAARPAGCAARRRPPPDRRPAAGGRSGHRAASRAARGRCAWRAPCRRPAPPPGARRPAGRVAPARRARRRRHPTRDRRANTADPPRASTSSRRGAELAGEHVASAGSASVPVTRRRRRRSARRRGRWCAPTHPPGGCAARAAPAAHRTPRRRPSTPGRRRPGPNDVVHGVGDQEVAIGVDDVHGGRRDGRHRRERARGGGEHD